MQQNIQEIEKVCLQFQYAEPSNIQSLQNQLLEIFKSPVSHDGLMPLLTIIFELYNYSKSEYVRKLAITHLKSLLCTKHHLFTKAELVQITTLQTVPYITAISSVLGWLDSEDYPNRFNTLLTETQQSPRIENLELLLATVVEMNPPTSSILHYSKHRKTAIQFRDNHLKQLLLASFSMYKQSVPSASPTTELLLKIVNACVSYDFLGTVADQDSEGMQSAVQIPASWKEFVIEEKPIELFASSLDLLPGKLTVQLLEIIGFFMGARRSLFVDTERLEHLKQCSIIVHQLLGRNFDETARSEFLKLLLRFTTVYGSDMKKIENISVMFESFYSFSMAFISVADCNDLIFLVQIWCQLRESEHPFFVEQQEKMKLFTSVLIHQNANMLERLYFDEENALQQLLPSLGKFLRKTGYELIAKELVNRLNIYGNGRSGQEFVEIAWTISLFSSVLSHRISYQATEDEDRTDGFVSGSIFAFLEYKVLQSVANPCEEHLEIAVLQFFEQFKQTYLTGDGSSCPKTWETLAAHSHLKSQEQVVVFFVHRVMYYIKQTFSEKLALQASMLFKELVNGVHTCKLLQSANLLSYIEQSGIITAFSVASHEHSKSIMLLFESIGRLFLTDHYTDNSETNLQNLLRPFQNVLSNCHPQEQFDEITLVVYKLRGILTSILTLKLYKSFFLWLQPHLPLFNEYLAQSDSSKARSSLNMLKFFRELTKSKGSRMQFDTCGEYGILLFRETTEIITNQIGKLEPYYQTGDESVWVKFILKPLCVIFDSFKFLISSRAVPFGILKLYQDDSLERMVQSVFLFSNSVNSTQLQQYPKLGNAYFGLWVSMTSDYMTYLMGSINEPSLNQLLTNAIQIIECQDNSMSSNALTIVNSIFSHAYPTFPMFFDVNVSTQAASFRNVIFERLMTNELETQWSFSRPLLPLILCDPEGFQQLILSIIGYQHTSVDEFGTILFGIMNLLDPNLSIKSRDRLTNNVETVKRDLRNASLTLNYPNL